MDSRQAFEEWWKNWSNDSDSGIVNLAFTAWQAGRASMRDEALNACLYSRNSEDVYASIKQIQP